MATKAKSETETTESLDHRLIKALAHPLRIQILTILNARTASPNEISRELGEGLSQVSYHVKVLRDYDCIELVRTEPRRGAVEHFYRAKARAFLTDNDWARLPDSIRPGMSAELVQAMFNDAAAALEADVFDTRDDRHVSWTPMRVDDEGWETLVEIMADSLERILTVRAASTERLAQAGEKGTRVSISMLGFPSVESEETHVRPKGTV